MNNVEFWPGMSGWVKKNDTRLMTAFGVVGMLGACISTGIATVKAVRAYDAKKEELGVDKLDTKTTIKTVWRYYIGPSLLAVASSGSIIASDVEDSKRYASLGAAYIADKELIKEYKDAVKEQVGEKKEEEINEKAKVERMKDNPPEPEVFNFMEPGDVLFFEDISKQYFICKISDIEKITNECNAIMNNTNWVSVNDLIERIQAYDKLGRIRRVKNYDNYGWTGYQYTDHLCKKSFGHKVDENDHFVAILYLNRDPEWNYKN